MYVWTQCMISPSLFLDWTSLSFMPITSQAWMNEWMLQRGSSILNSVVLLLSKGLRSSSDDPSIPSIRIQPYHLDSIPDTTASDRVLTLHRRDRRKTLRVELCLPSSFLSFLLSDPIVPNANRLTSSSSLACCGLFWLAHGVC
jgi:hypothetical protein